MVKSFVSNREIRLSYDTAMRRISSARSTEAEGKCLSWCKPYDRCFTTEVPQGFNCQQKPTVSPPVLAAEAATVWFDFLMFSDAQQSYQFPKKIYGASAGIFGGSLCQECFKNRDEIASSTSCPTLEKHSTQRFLHSVYRISTEYIIGMPTISTKSRNKATFTLPGLCSSRNGSESYHYHEHYFYSTFF